MQANRSMIETLNTYVAKFSVTQTSSKSKTYLTAENDENNENHSDNVRSGTTVDGPNRAILGDITSTACGEAPTVYEGTCGDEIFDTIAERSAVGCVHCEDVSSPQNMSSISDSSQNQLIKTPNLEEWKLSQSTRNFVVKNACMAPENRRRSMLGGSEPLISTTPLNSHTLSARKSILSSSRPSTVESMKLQTPQQLLKSCHLLAANDNISDTNFFSPAAIDTPETPEISTPFQTCDLRTKETTSTIMKRNDMLSSLDREATFSSAPSITCDLTDDFTCDIAATFTDIPSVIPTKKAQVTVSVPTAIPSILQSDWDKAPSFLKLQVTIEELNMSLMLLNKHIEKAKVDSDISIEMFTQYEIESILCGEYDCINGSSLKAIILGLVTLKRLDLGNENKMKVFRIKKSY